MKPIPTWQIMTLILLGVAAGAAIWKLQSEHIVAGVLWASAAAITVFAGVVLLLGNQVRKHKKAAQEQKARLKKPLNPQFATGIALLSQASMITGATLIGYYLIQAAQCLGDIEFEPYRDRFIAFCASVIASTLLLLAGYISERWCRTGPGGPGGQNFTEPRSGDQLQAGGETE